MQSKNYFDTTGPNHLKNYDSSSRKKTIIIAIILVALFTIIEFIGGYISNSLALMSDASHMFTDFISLCFALAGVVIAKLKNNDKQTYGYSRIEIIMSLINSLFLVFISAFIIFESINRFIKPSIVNSSIMLPIAITGLIINFVVMYMFHSQSNHHNQSNKKEEKSLLMQSAFLHFLSDTVGSIIAIAVSIIIYFTEWYIVDPILSLIFVILIDIQALRIIFSSSYILMEGSPKNLKAIDIKNELEKINGVVNIHHIHLWMLNEDENIITLHALIKDNENITNTTKEIKSRLKEKFNINHSTIQLEYSSGDCLN